MISASVDMLNYLGHKQYAVAIANAIRKTVVEDKILTPGMIAVACCYCLTSIVVVLAYKLNLTYRESFRIFIEKNRFGWHQYVVRYRSKYPPPARRRRHLLVNIHNLQINCFTIIRAG